MEPAVLDTAATCRPAPAAAAHQQSPGARAQSRAWTKPTWAMRFERGSPSGTPQSHVELSISGGLSLSCLSLPLGEGTVLLTVPSHSDSGPLCGHPSFTDPWGQSRPSDDSHQAPLLFWLESPSPDEGLPRGRTRPQAPALRGLPLGELGWRVGAAEGLMPAVDSDSPPKSPNGFQAAKLSLAIKSSDSWRA